MGTASAMIAQARATLGLGESPAGSNHNRVTVWYNDQIARIGDGAWCDMAITYWAGHSDNLAAIFAGRNVGYAYTVWHAERFEREGRWHPGTSGIKPGDVVFFDWSGSRSISRIDHVGIVERVSGGIVYTIEGNSADVCRRVARDSKYIVGYGRPKYAAPASGGAPVWPGVYYRLKTPMMRGDRVKWIQRRLNHHGAHLQVDGVLGPKTATATGSFQSKHHLEADKIVGPRTWAALGKE